MTSSFDVAEQDRLLTRIHEIVVDDAVQVWVVHGYTQAQCWFQDATTLP